MSDDRPTVNLAENASRLRETCTAAGMPLGGTVEVPVRIGPVELVRQVGEGGMGVVWLGRHDILKREVAVKFLLAAGTVERNEAAAEMFVQGARAAAAVRHTGLTAVHDAGVVNGVPYLVMEYIDGPTMAEVLRRGPISLGAVRTVLERVCEAVDQLHAQDLVHRDIKPANIMLTRQGEVMVTDFGLARPKMVRGAGAEESLGGATGTPAYMAPEMFRGELSAKSDVYAIGATAFELITGRPPHGGTLAQMRDAAEKGILPIERLAERGVPEELSHGIERCMNKDGVYRPRSAGRAWEVLRAAFESASPATRPASRDDLMKLTEAPAAAGGEGPEARQEMPAGAQTPIANTMFGLVSEMAERKRKSGPIEKAADEIKAAEASAPAPPPIVNVWPAGQKCAACGYSLGGLSRPRCPECGALLGRVPAPDAHGAPRAADTKPQPPPTTPRTPASAATAPVPWKLVVAFSLAGGALLSGVVWLLDTYVGVPTLLASHVAEWLGLWNRSSGPIVFQNVRFSGRTPGYLHFIVGTGVRVLPFAAVGAVIFLVYRRFAFRFRRAGAGVVCGWCGYDLAGIRGEQCPECGRGTRDRGRPGDWPPAHRWRARLRVAGVSMATLLIAGVGALMLGPTAAKAMSGLSTNWRTFTLGILFGTPMMFAGLLAYHLSARKTALLRGEARCARCGASGEPVRMGKCARCDGATPP